MRKLILLITCLFLCFGSIPVRGDNENVSVVRLYVSPGGNDKFSGSENFPFASLEKAVKTVRLLQEQTVVYLREGTYEGGLILDERDSNVVYRSYPGERVVILAEDGEAALSLRQCGSVMIKGIVFTGGSGAVAERCADVRIFDCEFREMEQGLSIDGDARIEGNLIQQIKGTGILVNSGRRESLETGNCVIVNNSIREYAQNGPEYPGIRLSGVGITLSHNEVSDADGCAIEITGNEHLIQYNKISRIHAPGAVCTQGDVTARGSKIRNNMIQDCTECGVLLNEFSSGITVFGNVFYRLNQAVKMLGGRNNSFQENLSVDCGASLALETVHFPYEKRKETQSQLDQVPYKEGVWLERYPELSSLMKDKPGTPKYNKVSGNLVFQTPQAVIDSQVQQNGESEADTVLTDASVFTSYEAGNFTLENGAPPCSQMGTKKEQVQALFSETVVLMLGSWSAVNHGEMTAIDPANHSVVPIEQGGRTLVPVRFVAESMGAKVSWNQEKRQVTVEGEGKTLCLTLGSKVIIVDGEEQTIDAAPVQKNDRTLIPLRAVAEALGLEVAWDPSGLIVISSQPVELEDEVILAAILRKMDLN